ncbi:uncharacterized protein BHQ10_004620 [Talaromyces amestolkiae]|uniref:Uncharacterized protein n=1 Tax=Talaromyces amestolkiae TaxID=1196081 RepID=A0A364KYI0_TALAM|nr:uncharacterized protein BHQ10_004620 [Talaromyces amestolkiae]RAO68608.1 hypothetical protein BHQ10_004620 [Talaromyces amestolkiae]
MSPLQAVFTTKAPKPLPQFSQAVKFGEIVYCSGNIGLNPESWTLVKGGVREETKQALLNLSAILEEAGSSINNIIKMNIFLTTMDDFALMNEAFDEVVKSETKPCRTCVAVYQLPLSAAVEIECSAFLNT